MLASFDAYATADSAVALPTFNQAIEMHKAMVYSIGWHFLRDRSAAEELAQEVFLQLHRNWSAMKSAEHMVSWLRKVASHRAIDFSRKLKRHPETNLDETAEPTALERVHDTFLSTYLERVVASLPEKQRIVVVLRYQEDMEIEEIAQALGMKQATVKTQLARALDLLKVKTQRRLGHVSEEL
ncbi:MAG: sigma-70 family RNA polymerase sigma factor [Acidobacteriota bacterium]|nr:sigma-70 family RNA polymerase sigma factor [Acidobacteriota bacterium]